MSVVKLRIEIERAVRDLADKRGVAFDRPTGIMKMLRDLHRNGSVPSSTEQMLDALHTMNEATHGMDVDPETAERAVEIGTIFLGELQKLNTDE